MNKYFIGLFFVLLLQISFVSAINLDITEEKISNTVIVELERPAIFDLTITNLEKTEDFSIYYLGGIDIFPNTPIQIKETETKKIRIELYPQQSIKENEEFYTFEYKIKASSGIQTDKLTINIVNLNNAFKLYADPITPESNKTTVHFKNKGDLNFEKINALIYSSFFSIEKEFSLAPYEDKQFEVEIDKDKTTSLLAGPYLLNAEIKIENKKALIDSIIDFLEKSGIESSEIDEGTFIRRKEIEKKNTGNTPQEITIITKKNLFSALFTTTNIRPTNKEIKGFTKYYTWQKTISPGESLKIVIRTNWLLLIIILACIILAIILTRIYLTSKLIIRKKVSFVKTKSGEFALKVMLNLKARKYVEKIKIIDKLPPMVKLFERYGAIAPDKVDEKNRRIEWDLEALDKGEERTLSYIIYSKISIIGKFELTPATAIYESNNVVREATSNKAYFINEPQDEKVSD